MAKKAVKRIEAAEPRKRTRQAPPPPIGEPVGQVVLEDLDLNAALVEARGRVFDSEQEALDFFFERLLKVEESAPERHQMREFLELLLETDPMLKEDLLSGVRVKK